MLNVTGWEFMMILLVALIFLGPERLPGAARQVGQTVNTLRSMARNFQTELEAAARPDALVPTEPASGDQSPMPGTDPAVLAEQARQTGGDTAEIKPVSATVETDPAGGVVGDEEE